MVVPVILGEVGVGCCFCALTAIADSEHKKRANVICFHCPHISSSDLNSSLCGPLRISAISALKGRLTQRSQRYAEDRRESRSHGQTFAVPRSAKLHDVW